MINERPAPNWMPFTTGMGTMDTTHRKMPVTLMSSTAAPTHCPAAVTTPSAGSSRPEMAAAAIACVYHEYQSARSYETNPMERLTFIGCTGSGIP